MSGEELAAVRTALFEAQDDETYLQNTRLVFRDRNDFLLSQSGAPQESGVFAVARCRWDSTCARVQARTDVLSHQMRFYLVRLPEHGAWVMLERRIPHGDNIAKSALDRAAARAMSAVDVQWLRLPNDTARQHPWFFVE